MNQHIPSTTYTNGRVTLRSCLVFSWVVFTTEGWLPVEQLDFATLKLVRDAMDYSALFPQKAHDFVHRYYEAAEARMAVARAL